MTGARGSIAVHRQLTASAEVSVITSDLSHAWSCTTSFLACQTGAGPEWVPDVRGEDPSRLVDRHQALVAVHSCQLLVAVAADPQRLATLVTGCRRMAEETARLRGGWAIARCRLGPPGNGCWSFALRALTRTSRHDIAERWTVGAELAEAASALVRDSDSDPDPSARARLLADAERTLARFDWSVFSATRPGAGPWPDQ